MKIHKFNHSLSTFQRLLGPRKPSVTLGAFIAQQWWMQLVLKLLQIAWKMPLWNSQPLSSPWIQKLMIFFIACRNLKLTSNLHRHLHRPRWDLWHHRRRNFIIVWSLTRLDLMAPIQPVGPSRSCNFSSITPRLIRNAWQLLHSIWKDHLSRGSNGCTVMRSSLRGQRFSMLCTLVLLHLHIRIPHVRCVSFNNVHR